MNSDQPINRFRTLLRTLLGLVLLAIVITWIIRHGTLIEQASFGLMLGSLIVSFFINLINAVIIKIIVDAYRGGLTYAGALHVSALGSFGNAGGGLPIGTGLKFAILHRRGRLKLREIAAGLAISAAVISFLLVTGMAASIWCMDFPFAVKTAPAGLLVTGLLLAYSSWPWLKKKPMARWIQPMLASGSFDRLFLACLLMAAAYLLNYLIIGHFLFPEIPVMQMIFMACFGILAGMVSLLQSVGGISEISMGIASYLSGARLIDGAQMALFMRFTSLISSGVFLALFYLLRVRGADRAVGSSRK